MQVEGWRSEWWWWEGGGAGGVAQIMQQLHCNSPRAGGLAAASEPTACSERSVSVHQPSAWPRCDWPTGVPWCVDRLREGLV
jgi:hypothetical protein